MIINFNCPYDCGTYLKHYGIIVCRPVGVLTADNMADIATCRDCLVKAGMSQVNRFHDLTRITSIDLRFDDVSRICEREARFRIPEKPITACYWVPNALLFGTIRMYAALIEDRGVTVHVSYDIDTLSGILDVEASVLSGNV